MWIRRLSVYIIIPGAAIRTLVRLEVRLRYEVHSGAETGHIRVTFWFSEVV